MTPETFQGKPCNRGHTLRYSKGRQCVECRRADSAEWRRTHPEKIREKKGEKHRLYRYGLSSTAVLALWEAQEWACACCRKPLPFDKINVDHDHTTGDVRGLLCSRCNVAIGFLGDDITGLEQAIDYLKRVPLNRRVSQ